MELPSPITEACERPMFEKLNLRSKLIAMAVPPMVVLMAVAIYGVILSVGGAQEDLTGDIRTLGIIALAGVVLTALVGVLVVRSIADPVDDITAATRDLADNRLPLLVEALRNPGGVAPAFPPIEFEGGDELGRLAEALNDVQDSATNVAAEQQTLVRQGLSELVVNMARRNQTLLDRQIEYIDRLESAEEDPDRLEELFGLDHLATRMRRNAESLLVLAGAESSRRRGGPVAVADVLRVAMSEIEDYRHVQLLEIEQSEIGASGAVDLAHLLSELMENATQFSPPDSPVEVSGTTHPDGSYLISIVDHGIGMSDDQIGAANQLIAHPPELGLSLSRSLGFLVIGRLAQRLDVRVELVHTHGGGVTAIIDVPGAVLAGGSATQSVTDDAAPIARTMPDAAMPAALGGNQAAAPIEEAPAPSPMGSPLAAPVANQPAPSLDENPFAPAPAPAAAEEAWTPPVMPERGANPIGGGSPAPATDVPAALAGGDDEAWSPPVMPERGANPIGGAPAAEAAPSSLPSDMPTRQSSGGHETPQNSEALSKLLGSEGAPTADLGMADAPSFDAPATDAPAFGDAPFGAGTDAPGQGADEAWTAPYFDGGEPREHIAPGAAPAKLEEAIPTGDSFDTGMDSLLEADTAPQAGTTGTGLAKRDRSKSQAPVSEGRPVAASVRSPDEIRSMLARYRDGLKGRPLEGLASDSSTDAVDAAPSDPFNNPGQAGQESNPWGDPS